MSFENTPKSVSNPTGNQQLSRDALAFVEALLLGGQSKNTVLAHRALQVSPAVWMAQADGVITFLGQQWAEITDRSSSEQLGTSFLESLHPDDRDLAAALWQESIQTQAPYRAEFRLRRADGTYCHCLARAEPALHIDSKQTQCQDAIWLGTFTDVERLRRFQSELVGDHQFLEVLLENLADGIVACDANGILTLFNRATQDFHGLPAHPIPPEQWAEHYDLYHPDCQTPLQKEEIPLFRALTGESVRDVKMVIKPKQGKLRIVLVSGSSIYDASGQKLGAIVAMRDITDREQVEAELCKSERRFRAIFNQTLLFVGLLEPDGILIEANQTALNIGGLSADQVIGRIFWEAAWWLNAPETQAQLQQAIAQAAQGGPVRFEVDLADAEGEVVTLDFSLKPILDEAGNVVLLVMEGRDITDRKRAYAEIDRLNATLEQRVVERTAQLEASNRQNEALLIRERAAKTEVEAAIARLELINCHNEELLERERQAKTEAEMAIADVRNSAERLSLATEVAKLGLWDLDCKTGQSLWNPRHEMIFGYSPGQPERDYSDWERCIHPEDLERVHRETHYARDERKDLVTQYRIIWPDGSLHWVKALGRFYYDADGQPCRMVGVLADVTDNKEAEKALRESEERYRTLVESTSLMVWNADETGALLSSQPGWTTFTGQTYEEFKGSGWLNAVHPADRDLTIQAWAVAVADRAPYEVEHRLRRADGTYRYMNVRAAPIFESNGRFREWIGVHADITDRRRAERTLKETEEQFRVTFDQAAVGIVHIHLDGHWLRVNHKFCQIVGYTSEELLSLTFQGITYPEDLHKHISFMEKLMSGEINTYSLEKRYISKQGLPVWVEVTTSLVRQPPDPLSDFEDGFGAPQYFIAVVEEIGDRKQAREALQERAQELTNLNTLISQAAALLEHRNQELDQFVHIVSHDLKAPLRAISNLSEWITADLEGQLPPDSQQQLLLLRTRAKRMESMINSLLMYARAGRGQTAYETFNVADLLNEVIDSLDPPREFSIQVHLPMPTVKTKRMLLQQVFANLISNAVKHHDSRDGHLVISAVEQQDFYEFAVVDDGPGIAEENHERIFAIFQTLKAQNSSESSGIGLAIVKKILEAEAGMIRVESQPGSGTAFFFTWPKSPL